MTWKVRLEPLKRQWKPTEKQKQAVKWLLGQSHAGLLLRPSSGKTSITLEALRVLKKAKKIRKVLIVAPLRVCYSVWRQEGEKWTQFNHFRFALLHGRDKEKELEKDADIYLINPEGLEWLLGGCKQVSVTGKKIIMRDKTFVSRGFDVLVVDELSKFKNTQTQRFKLLKPYLASFKRRWGLTGSPATNGLEGLFGQCYTLDEGTCLGRFKTHFYNKYFVKDFYGYGYTLRDGADREIAEAIKPLCLSFPEVTQGGEPEKKYNRIMVELDAKSKKIFKAMENELVVRTEKGLITAANAAVAAFKLVQVTSGFLYEEENFDSIRKPTRAAVRLHKLKYEALEELVDELQGRPLLCAYWFKEERERLKELFGVRFRELGSNQRESEIMIREFNAGNIPILFAQPQSAGHGINLQECCADVCWLSPTYDLELYEQFNYRVARAGNPNSEVVIHNIVTVEDLKIMERLAEKDEEQRTMFNLLQGE